MRSKLITSTLLWFSVLFVSCGLKSPPSIISCAAGSNAPGRVHLTPCFDGAPNPAQLDDHGNGATSACPSSDNVEIVLTRNGVTTYILPEQVHIGRAGDGIAVSIDADLN